MVEAESEVKKRILIVEDEMILAKNLEDILKDLGYEVVGIADNSMKAIMQFFLHAPDLILMDIHLKGQEDGIKTAEKILQQKLVPIIFITANQDTATFNRAKANGAYGYVLKPFQERELQIVIDIAFSQFEDKVKILKLENVLNDVERLNAIETFASGFIHAVNSALTKIYIGFDTIKNEEKLNINPTTVTGLNLVEAGADTIKNTLKSYSHILDSIALDTPYTFKIFDILKEALDICKYYALTRKVLIHELKSSQQTSVYISRSALFLAIVNIVKTICDLIQNSPDAWIEISWTEQKETEETIVHIIFSGELFSQEFKNTIFSPLTEQLDLNKVNKFAIVTSKNLLNKYHSDLELSSSDVNNVFVLKVKNIQEA